MNGPTPNGTLLAAEREIARLQAIVEQLEAQVAAAYEAAYDDCALASRCPMRGT